MVAPYVWENLPVTDQMLTESAVRPLPEPAESVAERLVFLAHMHFNPNEWSSRTSRIGRYWGAFQENVEAAATAADCAGWWEEMRTYMLVRETLDKYLTEKEALTHPTLLSPAVDDRAVLDNLARYPTTFVDRCRIWRTTRLDADGFTEGDL